MGYNSLKVYPLQFPLLVPLDQAIGSNIAMNSSPCPCSSVGLSTDHSPLGGLPSLAWTYSWATVSSGIYLLQPGLSHSRFEVYLLWHGLIHRPQSLLRGVPAVSWTYPRPQTLRGAPAPTWTYPQVTVPSTRVHTGVPAQQHRNNSNDLA